MGVASGTFSSGKGFPLDWTSPPWTFSTPVLPGRWACYFLGPGRYNYQPSSQQVLPLRGGFSVEEAAWGAAHGGGASLILRREGLRILQGLFFPMKNDFLGLPGWAGLACIHCFCFKCDMYFINSTKKIKLNQETWQNCLKKKRNHSPRKSRTSNLLTVYSWAAALSHAPPSLWDSFWPCLVIPHSFLIGPDDFHSWTCGLSLPLSNGSQLSSIHW